MKMVTYCDQCGHIGPIPTRAISCCPDARPMVVLEETAEQARRGLLDMISNPPKFPRALRKMWSSGEVQDWINENWKRK